MRDLQPGDLTSKQSKQNVKKINRQGVTEYSRRALFKDWSDMTEGSIEKENIMGTMQEGRLLLKLAMPMIFSVLVSSLYNIVDSIFVGKLGQNALTAISLGAPASSLMVELSFGVAVGVIALLSRKLGEKDSEGVSKAAGQGFLLIGVVYLICLAFGLFGVRTFYSMFIRNT